VPIVPVSIRGTFQLLPKTTLAPRPGRVDVIIGKPIETREYSDRNLSELIARTRAAIEANLEVAPREEKEAARLITPGPQKNNPEVVGGSIPPPASGSV